MFCAADVAPLRPSELAAAIVFVINAALFFHTCSAGDIIMARSIIGVIVGYVAMFILNFCVFVGLYAVVGPENAFKPHRYLASNRWILMVVVATFITAVIAGLICAAIAKGGKAPLALAVLIIVLGWLLAVPAIMKARANADMVRMGDVPSMEAAQKAFWPVWTPFALPVIQGIGALVGGKLRRR
jgi:undecaprenyl pyrophosphate phosphatase UppP